MKFKIWELSLLFALIISLLAAVSLSEKQDELSGKLIRLHIIANSDSEDDQTLKLKVRDAVLDVISEETADTSSKSEAENVIKENMGELLRTANETICGEGYAYSVKAELGEEYCPTRDYTAFSLPAGKYTSLRVTIGDGQGRNWWCVVFPPICSGAAIDDAETLNLSDEEVSLITKSTNGYVIKFKAMEIIGKIREMLK